jgi:hypothetical protein
MKRSMEFLHCIHSLLHSVCVKHIPMSSSQNHYLQFSVVIIVIIIFLLFTMGTSLSTS